MAFWRRNRSPEETQAKRRKAEVGFLRGAGSAGIVGLGAALGAILGAADVRAWVIGLVVAVVSLAAAGVLRIAVRP
jgi:hypothetical protein